MGRGNRDLLVHTRSAIQVGCLIAKQETTAMPALRDIMVVLDGTVRSEIRLTAAVDLARRHDAHVTGVSALGLLTPPKAATHATGYPELPLSPSQFTSGSRLGAAKSRDAGPSFSERIERIEAEFRQVLRSHGVQGNWLLADGKSSDAFAGPARLADLVVLGQFDPNHPSPRAGRQLVQHVLMTAGRPVLVIPYAGHFETIGTRILIGWNGSRAAARAVNDAMPLLAGAASVIILEAYPMGRTQTTPVTTGRDLRCHLAHHGIRAETTRTVMNGISATDVLLSRATDFSADLLVVGGSCHSRLRELILGGVTRGLLHDMTLPVLMSY
jgi:nucleotide-binding universal stress UspA family protein